MKHLNCFVLEAIAKQLNAKLKSAVLLDCYSNSPDDVIIVFENFHLYCIFYESEMYFRFNDSEISKSRLYKPQFVEIHETKVDAIIAHRFERSFAINFSNNQTLVFKCHGRSSNIILFENGEFSDMFRKMHEGDKQLKLENFNSKSEPIFDPLKHINSSVLQKDYPFLPSEFCEDLFSENINSNIAELCSKYSNIGGFTVTEDYNLKPHFELNTVLNDIHNFTSEYLKANRFTSKKKELCLLFEKEIKDKTAFIASNIQALEHLRLKRSDEEIGNIILAGSYAIESGSTSVVLNDIYNNTPIEIALDAKLNAVENAEKYFRKSKGIPHTIKLLETKIEAAQKRLNLIQEHYNIAVNATEWKDLKLFTKAKSQKDTKEELPFRVFHVHGYDVYVGKSADSNEKILNYYSDKDDIWLHAKDVSGSHVLIRCGKNKQVPQNVLEKAASLAAYYSKNRMQSLVTVAYTLRKFVRKIKGADKGKVSVQQENTLLVKPENTRV